MERHTNTKMQRHTQIWKNYSDLEETNFETLSARRGVCEMRVVS